MNYLVLCACSHALDYHAEAGCKGTPRRACACLLTSAEALERAVHEARSHYTNVLSPELAPKRQRIFGK